MEIDLKELGFEFKHYSEQISSNKNFVLHDHRKSHEIYLFLDGDAEFLVEGTRYPLFPNDIIIAQSEEMHCVKHNSFGRYERIVISLDHSFFIKNNCEAYQDIFTNRPLGENNRIPAEIVEKNGIIELLLRSERYLNDTEDGGVAALGTMLELLYILNHIGKPQIALTSQSGRQGPSLAPSAPLTLPSHLELPDPSLPTSLPQQAMHCYTSKPLSMPYPSVSQAFPSLLSLPP